MNTYAGISQTNLSNSIICDLRSDTLTQPNAGMRTAMANAIVGDDVYGEDPTAIQLEETIAEMLGKQAAVFFPTGTQSNLAALMSHCGRGDELIVGAPYHIYSSEAGGASVLAGISMCPLQTDHNASLNPDIIQQAIKADDSHYARSRLLCLENTVSGKAIPLQNMQAAANIARQNGLGIHLDGARFFNAITSLDCKPSQLADIVDTVSICLSKGLGAPLGTVLTGSHALMQSARRHRKILGGGMRQIGIAAAAGLYALENNLDRLIDDHNHATILGHAIRDLNVGDVTINTNMVHFTPHTNLNTQLSSFMAQQGIIIGQQSPTMRLVLHKDVTDEKLAAVISAFSAFFSQNQS